MHSDKQQGWIGISKHSPQDPSSNQFITGPFGAVPRLLTATQDAVRAANRGEHEDWWPDEALLWLNPTWWFSDGAAGLLLAVPAVLAERRGPARKSDGEDCWWAWLHTEDVLWSLKDLICIVLICSQQTVARLWRRSTLTNTRFDCGEQIVSTLILSNVCLSFIWAAHEKFSDTGAMPEVTSHHIFSSYEARRLQDVKEGDMTKPPLLANVYVSTPFLCVRCEGSVCASVPVPPLVPDCTC